MVTFEIVLQGLHIRKKQWKVQHQIKRCYAVIMSENARRRKASSLLVCLLCSAAVAAMVAAAVALRFLAIEWDQ
ncbi:hypothetical protein ABKV19_008974 [Rosa sericea]